MKINFLIAALVVGLAPSAFSQQLIADSITNPEGNSPNALLCLGVSALADGYGIAIGYWARAGYSGVSIGEGSEVGPSSYAFGAGNWAQNGSFAIGASNQTTGTYSSAVGFLNNATGAYSMALGSWAASVDDYAVVLGPKNLSSSRIGTPSPMGWYEDSVLLELGNGDPNIGGAPQYWFSNAITTLKNGQTTLTNKAWLNRGSGTPATSDPSSATTDSGGNALVVDGHTVLNGKVIITVPQGDISMGIYQ